MWQHCVGAVDSIGPDFGPAARICLVKVDWVSAHDHRDVAIPTHYWTLKPTPGCLSPAPLSACSVPVVAILEDCQHEVVVMNLCATCGADVTTYVRCFPHFTAPRICVRRPRTPDTKGVSLSDCSPCRYFSCTASIITPILSPFSSHHTNGALAFAVALNPFLSSSRRGRPLSHTRHCTCARLFARRKSLTSMV